MTVSQASPPAPEGLLADRGFLWLVAGAGAVRLGLMLAMWSAVWALGSKPPLEVLSYNLHAIDALNYHAQAGHIIEYWQGGRPFYFEILNFSAVLGLFYYVLPAHPLTMAIVKVLCYTAAGLFARGLAVEMGRGRNWARGLALVFCLWPPTLAWSAVPLREGLVILTLVAILYLILRLCRSEIAWPERMAAGIGLVAAMAVLVLLRYYLWPLLWFLLLAPLAALALGTGPRGRRPGLGAFGWCLLFLLAGLLASQPWSRSGVMTFNKDQPSSKAPAWELVGSAHAETLPRPESSKRFLPPQDEAGSLWFRQLQELSRVRRNWVRMGGNLLSPEAQAGEAAVSLEFRFNGWRDSLAVIGELIWASFRDVFLFPMPWRGLPGGGVWWPVQAVVIVWSALWWLALPGLAWGIARALRRRPLTGVVVVWCLLLALFLGVTVLNRGTMFRIRDMALLPLFLLWHPGPYLWAARVFGWANPQTKGD